MDPDLLRSKKVRSLDVPPLPPEDLLDDIRSALTDFPQISEAWLLREEVTPVGGAPCVELSVALAFRDQPNPDALEATEVIGALSARGSVRSLGVASWTLVNEGIRDTTERHGVRIYTSISAG